MHDTRPEYREPFPMDWDKFLVLWREWRDSNLDAPPSNYLWPRKSLMADSVLGTWNINGTDVELSAVTFLEQRFIGVTYGAPDEVSGTDAGPLVRTFKELAHTLIQLCDVDEDMDEDYDDSDLDAYNGDAFGRG